MKYSKLIKILHLSINLCIKKTNRDQNIFVKNILNVISLVSYKLKINLFNIVNK